MVKLFGFPYYEKDKNHRQRLQAKIDNLPSRITITDEMVSKALGNIEVTCDADRIDLFANEDQENRNPNQLKNKK